MSASARGMTTGVIGSAAVLLVAALSLSAAHAEIDRPAKAHAAHAGGPAVGEVRVQPTAGPTAAQPTQPLWLKRLLSRSELLEPKPRRS